MKKLLGLLIVLLPVLAYADFLEGPCFPVGAGACVKVPNNLAVSDGQLMVRDQTPDIVMHDIDATDGDDNSRFRTSCTTTTAAAEDCDVTVSVQVAGALTDRITIDADGSTTIPSFDGEQISDDTIDDDAIDFADVTCVDMTMTDCAAVTSTATITAAVGFDCTGAADCDYGSADITDHTFTTDGTGDGEIVLPENSLGPDEVAVMHDDIILCGNSFNATTGYIGPGAAHYLGGGAELAIGGTNCDGIPESTTEATADEPIATDFPAFKVSGFYCRISSDPASDVVITARSAAANLTPSVTCTIAGAGSATSCSATTGSTTDVAAGATIAMQVVTLEDLSAQDVWCKMYIAIK